MEWEAPKNGTMLPEKKKKRKNRGNGREARFKLKIADNFPKIEDLNSQMVSPS